MKKILFIVNTDWFFISHRLPLALKAQRKGYDVLIACGITDKQLYLENFGFTVYPLPIVRSSTNLRNEVKTFNAIYTILKSVRPNIAHFITIKPVLYGGIASNVLSIPLKVFSISGLGFIFIQKGLKASLRRFFITLLYRFALNTPNTHIIVQNPDDQWIINTISNAPVTLIKGSGVDLAHYPYVPEHTEPLRVVMACRLLKDKGVYEYLEAVRMIKIKERNIIFELYGDIDLQNPASLTPIDIEQIKQEGIITFHGFTHDIASVFANANIVVLPSYREGLPKVLIEAAACGRAVITTDVPGCKHAIIPNITGLLCDVKNSVSLAKQIEKLIYDHDLRQKMGKAGRDLALKEFNIQSVVKKHFDIYESFS